MRMLLVPSLLLAFAVRAGADDPVEKGKERWAVGTKVLPTKRTDDIPFGIRIDEKQVYFKLSGNMPMEVRKDNGDGWVRIHDGHREGWVQKENLVTKEDAPIFWDKAVKANPKDTFALHMRGSGWCEKGEYDNAIADFNECIRVDPANLAAYNWRGIAWGGKKNYRRAIDDFTEVIRLDTKYASAFRNRGYACFLEKDYDKAIVDFTEAIRLDPKYVSGYYTRGRALSANKKHNKAIEDFDEALKIDAKSASALGRKAVALAKLNQYDHAVEGFEAALKLDPMDWLQRDYAFFCATCPDAKCRDGKKAVEMAKSALEKAGKDADWQYSAALAAAYAEVGDFELAVSEQRKALDDKHIHPTDKKEQEARLVLYRAKKPHRDE